MKPFHSATFLVALIALGGTAAATPTPTVAPRVRAIRAIYEAAVADPSFAPAFEAFKASLPDDGRGHFILEGDLLLSEAELRTYLEDLGKAQRGEIKRAGELTLATKDGIPSFWPAGQRTLGYWIDRGSFRSAAEADLATEAMQAAATDWESRCRNCNIDFRVLPDAQKEQAAFQVAFVSAPRPIARAFFPYTAPAQRKVEIFTPFFEDDLGFDRNGVLRHELGHVLGYRHEHTRGVNGCFYEDDQWIAVTPYDSNSVMHYLCGGAGNPALTLSDMDAKGHECVYVHNGPPCPAQR